MDNSKSIQEAWRDASKLIEKLSRGFRAIDVKLGNKSQLSEPKKIIGFDKKGYTVVWADGTTTTEPVENLVGCPKLITDYWKAREDRMSKAILHSRRYMENKYNMDSAEFNQIFLTRFEKHTPQKRVWFPKTKKNKKHVNRGVRFSRRKY